MLTTLKRLIKQSWGYRLYREKKITRSEYKRFLHEAKQHFAADHPEHGSLAEYEYCLRKYRVTYSEYMHQYRFWQLTDAQREAYVSVSGPAEGCRTAAHALQPHEHR